MDQRLQQYRSNSPILEAYERETEEFAALVEKDQRRQECYEKNPPSDSPNTNANKMSLRKYLDKTCWHETCPPLPSYTTHLPPTASSSKPTNANA